MNKMQLFRKKIKSRMSRMTRPFTFKITLLRILPLRFPERTNKIIQKRLVIHYLFNNLHNLNSLKQEIINMGLGLPINNLGQYNKSIPFELSHH